jgi:hypothetical protein
MATTSIGVYGHLYGPDVARGSDDHYRLSA